MTTPEYTEADWLGFDEEDEWCDDIHDFVWEDDDEPEDDSPRLGRHPELGLR